MSRSWGIFVQESCSNRAKLVRVKLAALQAEGAINLPTSSGSPAVPRQFFFQDVKRRIHGCLPCCMVL
jgi:hypothetical protein